MASFTALRGTRLCPPLLLARVLVPSQVVNSGRSEGGNLTGACVCFGSSPWHVGGRRGCEVSQGVRWGALEFSWPSSGKGHPVPHECRSGARLCPGPLQWGARGPRPQGRWRRRGPRPAPQLERVLAAGSACTSPGLSDASATVWRRVTVAVATRGSRRRNDGRC